MFGDKTMEAFTPSEIGEDELLEMQVEALVELRQTIEYAIHTIENYEPNCCGMACNCYENAQQDLKNALTTLDESGFDYLNGSIQFKIVSECGNEFVDRV
jgi:hypothetical protein